MSITKYKMWAALLVATCAYTWGGEARVAAQERKNRAEAQDKTIVKGTLASVDADKNTITVSIHTFNRATQEGTDTDKTFPLLKDARILQDDTEVKVGELKKGHPVIVKLDGTSAASVSVEGGTSQGEFLLANLERNTITVIAGRDLAKQVYHLLKTTKVIGGDAKAMLVKDLKPGAKLLLTRSVEDDHTAIRIQALPEADKKQR
jgi:hypothetical protein